MKTVVFNPRRLDVAAFAKAQTRLEGRQALADLSRLAEGLLWPADEAPALSSK